MTDELLVKYLLQETSPEENQMVIDWLAADPAHRKQFDNMELIWKTSRNLASTSQVDENEAWQRFKARTQENKATTMVRTLPQRQNSWWLRIAAILVILSSAALLLFRQSETDLGATAQVRTEMLPDGSEVTLNRNSSLTYSSRLLGGTRNVKLTKGEVFFKVKPDKSKPFIITAEDVKVEVVGTSFNVKRSESSTEIIVETGIVRVSEGTETVTLKAGEKVLVKANTRLRAEPNRDQQYNYYRSKILVADNTPLWRVVEVLNEAYDVDIVIENPQIRDLPLNTTFKDQSLNQILKVISETFNISVTPMGKKIILK